MPEIDLRINAADLADTFEHMRMWLDHEDCVCRANLKTKIVARRNWQRDDPLVESFEVNTDRFGVFLRLAPVLEAEATHQNSSPR